MYYTIYKITNQIDGKVYIGSHKTRNLDDDYMGSGKYLKYAIEKYGVENFKKEVLFVYDNAKEMYDKEAEIVNEDFLATQNTYNLKVGGFGGFDYINERKLGAQNTKGFRHSDKTKKILSDKFLGRPITWKEKISEAKKGCVAWNRGGRWDEFDIRHSQNFQTKEKNSQFNSRWITNDIEEKKVSSTYILEEGWRFGRLYKPRKRI